MVCVTIGHLLRLTYRRMQAFLSSSVHRLRHLGFVSDPRLLTVSATVVLALVLGFLTVIAVQKPEVFVSCPEGGATLVYPLYDKRGTVHDTRTVCAPPHRGCILRANARRIYDCSPFMAPDNLWAQGTTL